MSENIEFNVHSIVQNSRYMVRELDGFYGFKVALSGVRGAGMLKPGSLELAKNILLMS